MDFEIGIVCARCDTYGSMGATECAACGSDLALANKPEKIAGPVSQSVSTSARAGLTEPPSSFLGDPLKPRRNPSGQISIPINAIRSQGGESAVSSSGAFDNRGSAAMRVTKSRTVSEPRVPAAASQHEQQSLEELMDQAKNFVCRSCSTPVPMGHKFCGRCGAAIPPDILGARTQFFGQLQAPGKAKLILIRGEGVEGLSYQLNAEQHVVGRNGQLVFPDDPFVSPKHANLFYRGGKLVVRDEGSLNGVFWRVRGTVDLAPGDFFLAGEQLFRVDGAPKMNDAPGPDGTYFYSSPKHQSPFRIVQILQGGAPGMTVCARAAGLQIGREGGDLNFPGDLYMSASHCKLEDTSGKLALTDLNSRNGTYVRLKAEKELAHGDYLFIGRKLLRVEITASA
jgi:pSer/pThr/pTyr-binding forkhead associated (FHA) protein